MLEYELNGKHDAEQLRGSTSYRVSPPPRPLWYMTQRKNWDGHLYWNVVWFVEVLFKLDPAIVSQVVKKLLEQHDALQLCIKQDLSEYFYEFPPINDKVPFSCEDLSSVPEEDLPVVIENIAKNYQINLNLVEGSVLRVVLFDLGPQKNQRLLVIVSHSVCDRISLQILMSDFMTFYLQMSQGLSIPLPPKTTSLKSLLEAKWRYSETENFKKELTFWRSLPWHAVTPLPVDYPENRNANTRESLCTVVTSLSPEETNILLRDLLRATQSRIMDILLTVLMQTLAGWTGSKIHAFFLINHGRITPFPGVDLSRTVGNLISVPQILLDLRSTSNIWEELTTVKKQFHRYPHNGLMWEWLPLEMTLKSDLAFNYEGQRKASDQVSASLFRPAPEATGPQDDPKEEHWTLISCTCSIKDKSLSIHWDYSKNLYKKSTIENLANEYLNFLRLFITRKKIVR